MQPLHRYWIPPKEPTVNQQIKAYLISFVRLFIAAVIAAYLLLGKQPLELGAEDWEALLNAGIGALIVSLGNALNPADNRYGIGAPRAKELSAGDVATNATGSALNDPGEVHIDLTTVVALVLLAIIALALLGVIGPR